MNQGSDLFMKFRLYVCFFLIVILGFFLSKPAHGEGNNIAVGGTYNLKIKEPYQPIYIIEGEFPDIYSDKIQMFYGSCGSEEGINYLEVGYGNKKYVYYVPLSGWYYTRYSIIGICDDINTNKEIYYYKFQMNAGYKSQLIGRMVYDLNAHISSTFKSNGVNIGVGVNVLIGVSF